MTRSWMLPDHVCKAILYHHDHAILAATDRQARNNVCDLIALTHMTECIADEYLFVNLKEWPQFEQDVLRYFELSEQDFGELKGDVLAFLNGE